VLACRIDATGGYLGGTGSGSGEANTATNVGSGRQVFKQKSGVNLEFRSLVEGSNVSLTQNADTVVIAASAGVAPLSTRTESATYTATLSDDVILVNANSGAVTIDLPVAATANGKVYQIKKIDASANDVIIDGDGSETIDGALTQVTNTQYESFSIVCNGTEWFVI